MLALANTVLTFLLGLFGFKKAVDPSVTQLADSNAHAEDRAAQETGNAEVTNAALQARTDADARVMRDDPDANQVHSDPTASVNNLPGEHFRD